MRRSTDPSDIAAYLSDESRLPGGSASAIVWPQTAREAADVLRECSADGTMVTVSGAGTGIVGGRVPQGGIVLATDKLKAILALDKRDGGGVMRVQPGVTLDEVQRAAAAEGLMYPPDPTEWSAAIGGTIATNASGARSFRFGATRQWVERILVAFADGTLVDLPRGKVRARNGAFEIPRDGRFEILRDGPFENPRDGAATLHCPAPDWPLPHTTKHAAGYWSAPDLDLVDLIVGSEGTLGVVLEADLALITPPSELLSGILFFDGESAALRLVAAARESGLEPWALEFFDAHALELVRAGGTAVPTSARAGIFFEQPVGEGALNAMQEAWFALAETHHADANSWIGESARDDERFRAVRHSVPVAINETNARRRVTKVSTDTAVPRGAGLALLEAYRRILEGADLEHATFGHAGDDHFHVNILPREPAEQEKARETYRRLVRCAVEMGGTVSAEHGIGKLKREQLTWLYAPEVLQRMRAIKSALDPAGILGKGILFVS